MNTTNKCVELFYWIDSDQLECTLSIKLQTEVLSEILAAKVSLVLATWRKLSVRLPDGPSSNNAVILEARRDTIGGSKITIDDLMIQDCDQFGKLNNIGNNTYFFTALGA